MKMSLKHLAVELSEDLGMSQKKAELHLQAIFKNLGENVALGHEVNIPGFGKFRRKDKAARVGRNPKTGEALEIPAKSVPNFLPAKQLKEDCAEHGL